MSAEPGRVRRAWRGLKSLPRQVWHHRLHFAIATLCGVGAFLSFPAWNLFPLAFVTLAPLVALCERHSTRGALALATWMGFVTNLGGFYWIINMLQDYGYMPWSVSALLYAMLAAQQGLVWGLGFGGARWATRRGVPVLPAYVAGLMVAESVVPLIFPWYFGNSQYLNHAFSQAAELGGVVLLTGLVVCANVGIYLVVEWRRRAGRFPISAAVALGAVLLAHLYGVARISAVDAAAEAAEPFGIGVVQANIGIYEKGDGSLLPEQLLLHQQLSTELAERGADLIVWPETAYEPPAYYFSTEEGGGNPVVSPRLDRSVTAIPNPDAPLPETLADDDRARVRPELRWSPQRGHDVPTLVGAIMWSRRTPERMDESPPRGGRPWPWDIHNSALLLDEAGTVLGTYDKTLRMVFSEHIPGGRLLWRLTGINLYRIIPAAGDFYPGQPTDGFVLPTESGDVRIGIMICYEDIMPSFGRAIHAGRPHVIVNITNDAWFGDTAEPELHMALSVFRAIEQRTTLVRATNTGISAFIDPVGRVVAATETYEQATLLHETPRLEATTTPFMRFGNWPPAFAVLWCLLARMAARRRDQRGRKRAT